MHPRWAPARISIEKFLLADDVVFPESFEHRGFNRAHAATRSSAFSTGHAAKAGTNTSGAGGLWPSEAWGLIVLWWRRLRISLTRLGSESIERADKGSRYVPRSIDVLIEK